MKILAVADEESRFLWDFYEKEKLKDIQLILSCGDLDAEYLSFLATVTSVPVLYVRGNHDDKYMDKAPEGCICIENQIYVHEGVRILGLGGSMRYRQGLNQYTEKEMADRVRRMRFKIMKNGGFDILLTHAPARGLNDGDDLPHRGFQTFNRMMDRYQPGYFIHGHMHMNYGNRQKRLDQYGKTQVINACERYVFEYKRAVD